MGHSRKQSKSAKKKISDIKNENPRMTATSIYLRLIEDGDIYQKDISLSTVTRFVSTLPNARYRVIEDMRAFEMKHSNDLWQLDTTYCSYFTDDSGKKVRTYLISNDLWQLDTTYCSYFTDDSGKKVRTYLIMIIDDYSRMIVGYGFFLEDNAVNVQNVLRRAVAKFGVPKRIFTDNGSPYRNEQLSLICASLQIQISRAKPYHGNQKSEGQD